jgi:murein hydrolase activator
MKEKSGLHIIICLTLIFLFFSLLPSKAQQNPSDLTRKKEQIGKSIEYTNFLLNQTQKEKNATLHELNLIQVRIDSRRELINQRRIEQGLLMDTIAKVFIKIDSLESKLDNLKISYRNLLRSAYRQHNAYQKALFVLASDNLNQAWRRIKYYDHYSQFIQQQIHKIEAAETEYAHQIVRLEAKAERNQNIINDIFSEYVSLESDIAMKDYILEQLNEQIGQLTTELKHNRMAALELEKQIEDIVETEREKSLQAGLKIMGLNVPETGENFLLSSEFEDNKGKLPWPLEKGVISIVFGEHNHPKLENLKIKNNGINILTHSQAKVKSVFSGVVTRIMAVPNFNNVVIIRHGDFLTVYSNLSSVFVETGSRVDVQQTIGTVYTDDNNGKTELHFEIWNGKNLLNPAEWLLDIKQIIISGKSGK